MQINLNEYNCRCGHSWLAHNRFMGDKIPFGCIHCDCTKFTDDEGKNLIYPKEEN